MTSWNGAFLRNFVLVDKRSYNVGKILKRLHHFKRIAVAGSVRGIKKGFVLSCYDELRIL